MQILGFILTAPSTGKQYMGLLTPTGAMTTLYGAAASPRSHMKIYVDGDAGEFTEGANKINHLWRQKTAAEYDETFAAILDVPDNASPSAMAVALAKESDTAQSESFMRLATKYRSLVARGESGRPAASTPAPQRTTSTVAARASLPFDRTQACMRPNGEQYFPRDLGGHADVAALRAFRHMTKPINVLLVGPAGSGKTGLAEAAHGDELITIAGHGDKGVEHIVGKYEGGHGGWTYIEGPLIQAMKKGHVLLVDEINKLPDEVLSVFHSVGDGRGVLYVDDRPSNPVVTAQPGFALIGTLNPDAMGANGLPEAITSRFGVSINVSSDFVAAATLGVPRKFITVAENLETRNAQDPNRHPVWVPQMRELLDAKKLIDAGLGDEFAAGAMLNQCPYPEDVHEVADVMRQVLGATVVPLQLGGQL